MNKYKIRILAIKTADDDGSHAASVSATKLAERIIRATEIFKKANIEFLFDPAVDIMEVKSTLLNRDITLYDDPKKYTSKSEKPPHNSEIHSEARWKLASLFTDRLCIFFSYRTRLKYNETAGYWEEVGRGGSSGWSALYVNMPGGGGGINDLAHEIGHYLQIRHPFVGGVKTVADAATRIKKYVEEDGYPKSEGLNALDGDRSWVTDTPADAAGSIFVSEGLDKCGSVGEIPIPVNFTNGISKTYVLKPDRSNIMSYFKDCPGDKSISSQQAIRVRDGLDYGLRHDLISLKAREIKGKITRKGSATAGGIGMIDIAYIRAGRVATAVRTREKTLKVIVWDISSNGNTVTRKGAGEAGIISDISACCMGLGLLATAVRDSNGNLKVIMWQVTSSGNVIRKESGSAGAVSVIATCRIGIEYLATAVRDSKGKLKVIVWHVTAEGGIKRVGDAGAGIISDVSLSSVGHDSVAAHVKDSKGNLKIIVWRWQAKEKKLVRLDSINAGMISALAAENLDRYVQISAVRDSNNNLKVITWHVSSENDVVTRRGDGSAGAISKIACCRMGKDLLVTAVRDSGNNLKVILWEVGASGYHIGRRGSGSAGGVGKITVCPAGSDLFATAIQDRHNNFKVIAWKIS